MQASGSPYRSGQGKTSSPTETTSWTSVWELTFLYDISKSVETFLASGSPECIRIASTVLEIFRHLVPLQTYGIKNFGKDMFDIWFCFAVDF